MSLISEAISLAEAGFPIFPCNQDKRPLIKGGFKSASTDINQITAWWTEFPTALIGMPTGEISGTVVLDVDNKGDVNGSKTLEDIEDLYEALPETPIATTQSGGYHYHFNWPGVRIKCSAGKLGEGIDIRGDGGYVIIPPSKGYMWYNDVTELADMPSWLIDETRDKQTKQDNREIPITPGTVTVGNRNNHLASVAGTLRSRGMDESVILATLLAENQTFPQPLDVEEVETIASSIARYESQPLTNPALDNEDGIALQFSEKTKDILRYVKDWGKWMVWRDGVWQMDRTIFAYDLIRTMCRELFGSDEKARRKFLTNKTVASLERMAQADRTHAATTDQWDQNDWVINTPAGHIDLTTGQNIGHVREEYSTKITSVPVGTNCPTWHKFLNDVTAGNKELIEYLQRLAGYAMTGSIKEQGLFFVYGTGGNGKGTFINTLHKILNDYSTVAASDMFVEQRGSRHPTELAALRGARLVIAQETDEGRGWDEVKIKTMTGGDVMTARFMRQDFFEFMPKFTLVIAGNHKPALKTVDESIRRRFHMIPFTVTIPKEKRDLDLPAKLEQEMDGILGWMVEGCLEYQKQGLNPPEIVLHATEEYFNDEDVFTQWVSEKCEVGPDQWCPPSALFDSWRDYAYSNNFPAGTQKPFKQKLENAGFPQKKSSAKGGRYHEGIRVKIEEVEPSTHSFGRAARQT